MKNKATFVGAMFVGLAALLLLSGPTQALVPPNAGVRGDCNGDGKLNYQDIVYLTNYLFKGGPRPVDMKLADYNRDGRVDLQDLVAMREYMRGDANGDGSLDVSDAVYLLNYLFNGGKAPVDMQLADFNRDGRVDIADPVAILDYLF